MDKIENWTTLKKNMNWINMTKQAKLKNWTKLKKWTK